MISILRDLLHRAGLSRTELAGQTAVVTGAGRGIGRAVAEALALLGAHVVVAERSEEGEAAAEAIRQAGRSAQFIATDVADEGAVARLAAAAKQAFGPVSILINNAILCPVAPVEEMEPALWDRVIAVNMRGPFLTSRAFLQQMRQLGGGVVVNMVSTDGMPGLSAYIASKQGLTGFSHSLASEVGSSGIRVVALGPGMVKTPGLMETGERLAPLLGMPVEEFRTVSLHPAFDGPMEPAWAAAATAFLVARMADDCHGGTVTAYEVLEQAGLLRPAAAPASPVAPQAEVPADALAAAAPLADRLHAILAETDADFNRLPLFVRPLARSQFRSRSGQSIQEWLHTATALQAMLRQRPPGHLAGEAARLVPLLERLIQYVQAVPGETARFTRDAEMLKQVGERMSAYEADLMRLRSALDQLAAPEAL